MGEQMSRRNQMNWPKVLAVIAAPFVVFVWAIFNPRKVWNQAKKDWSQP
jgi:hypothetical protein